MYTPVHPLLKNYFQHFNSLWNLITRLKDTVIFQILALYMNLLRFCACWKLELCFVHMIENCKQNLNTDLKIYDENGNYILLAFYSRFQFEKCYM